VIEEPLPPTIVGPDLTLTAGEELPEVIMRFVDAEDNAVSQESGRTYKITMYRERKLPAEDMAEAEIIRQPIQFGDQRQIFADPFEQDTVSSPVPPPAARPGKGSISPEPGEEEEGEEEEPPYEGEEMIEGIIEKGQVVIGKSPQWLIPVHLQPAIYWLRFEETTQFPTNSIWQAVEPLEVPVRVILRPVTE